MDRKITCRGFTYFEFKDRYDETCTLQKSSLASEDCIWFGSDGEHRMHLTKDMVKDLIPILQKFSDTGLV